MAVVIIPNLGATPLIDTVSPDDYLLLGDQSAGGELKRVLIESLPDSSIGKLAIADYDWSTIPNKPADFAPNKLAIANYDWSTIPNKPTSFQTPDLSKIISTAKPLVRVDGSALRVFDRWQDQSLNLDWFWNGTYWLSTEEIVYSLNSSGVIGATFSSKVVRTSGASLNAYGHFLSHWDYAMIVAGTVGTNNYYTLRPRYLFSQTSQNAFGTISPDLNSFYNFGRVTENLVLQAANVTGLGVSLAVGGGSPTAPQGLCVSFVTRYIAP